jgi:16S rRNA (uracil1498-N3)-methyltransferase
MDRLLQKATELGVDEIWLLTSEFAQVGWARANTRMTHWHKILVRAAEQSRRAYLPKLHSAVPVEQFLRTETTSTLILLQPGSPPLPRDLVAQETTLIVGPEGGWAPSELDAAASRGIALHGLGNLTMRAETAPMVALAAIQHAWGWP